MFMFGLLLAVLLATVTSDDVPTAVPSLEPSASPTYQSLPLVSFMVNVTFAGVTGQEINIGLDTVLLEKAIPLLTKKVSPGAAVNEATYLNSFYLGDGTSGSYILIQLQVQGFVSTGYTAATYTGTILAVLPMVLTMTYLDMAITSAGYPTSLFALSTASATKVVLASSLTVQNPPSFAPSVRPSPKPVPTKAPSKAPVKVPVKTLAPTKGKATPVPSKKVTSVPSKKK